MKLYIKWSTIRFLYKNRFLDSKKHERTWKNPTKTSKTRKNLKNEYCRVKNAALGIHRYIYIWISFVWHMYWKFFPIRSSLVFGPWSLVLGFSWRSKRKGSRKAQKAWGGAVAQAPSGDVVTSRDFLNHTEIKWSCKVPGWSRKAIKKDSKRIQKGFRKDSKGFNKDLKKIEKDSRRIQEGFNKDSKSIRI